VISRIWPIGSAIVDIANEKREMMKRQKRRLTDDPIINKVSAAGDQLTRDWIFWLQKEVGSPGSRQTRGSQMTSMVPHDNRFAVNERTEIMPRTYLCRSSVRTLADRWDRQCGHKFRHYDLASAEAEAARLERAEKAKFNAYHCDCCGSWHVGHSNSVV
jgi:hypothetical protein